MDCKGNDALLKTTRITEWTVDNGGYLSLMFGGFLLLGCLSAYIIAVARGSVEPFLPLISDAAGSPPQSGIFGTLICLGGMIGVLFMLLRFMIVMEKNQGKSQVVLLLNKLSLIVGIISMLAITLITGYPINFYRNRDVWLSDVGIPHMIGGVTLFSFGIVYLAIQCILTLYLKPKDNSILFTRLAICAACTVAFVYHLVTVPDNLKGITQEAPNELLEFEESTPEPFPRTLGASLKLPIETNGTYLSSAITEWLLVVFFCSFFATFFKETQDYTLQLVIETQGVEAEDAPETNGKRQANGKDPMQPPSASDLGERRASEVRTLFRRDSTCQTLDEDTEAAVATNPKFTSFENGKYKKMQCSSFDILSGNNLEKLIESTMKAKTKVATVENGTDAPVEVK